MRVTETAGRVKNPYIRNELAMEIAQEVYVLTGQRKQPWAPQSKERKVLFNTMDAEKEVRNSAL